MKKIKFYCLFIFQIIAISNQAQNELNNEDHDLKQIRFGINIGMNRSNFNFTRHPKFISTDSIVGIESINNSGINLALLVNYRLSYHFDVRVYPLNLTFSEKAFLYNLKYPFPEETVLETKKVQSISLSLPIQIKFNSDRINNFRFYTFGGIRPEYDLASNAGARKAENLIKLRKLDLGPEVGLGCNIYFPFFVLSPELKFGWGLNNLHAYDKDLKFSNTIDKINSRSFTFSITIE